MAKRATPKNRRRAYHFVMLDLDYAFLADYATIQNGTLTAVGASLTRLDVDPLPTVAMLSVAGRLRCDEPERNSISMSLRIIAPGNDGTAIEATSLLDASEVTHSPYRGHRRGIVFAVQVSLPLLVPGTYRVEVDLEETDEIDRVLYFEVRQSAPED